MSGARAEPEKPQVVCVMGMSRSGTSVATRVLNALGMYIGPDEVLLEGREANPKGHWEHLDLMRLNQAILHELGGRWHEPPPLPAGWEEDHALDPLREQAAALIRKTFAGVPLWGWKDPRNCLTLPFWKKLLPDMRYVICVRNPLDVAASLERREGMPADKALALWLRYVTSSILNTADGPRLFLFVEDFFDDWRRPVAELARFLGRPERAGKADVELLLEDWLERELWHHRSSVGAALGDPAVTLAVKSLYLALEVGMHGAPQPEAPAEQATDDSLTAYARYLASARAGRGDPLHAPA